MDVCLCVSMRVCVMHMVLNSSMIFTLFKRKFQHIKTSSGYKLGGEYLIKAVTVGCQHKDSCLIIIILEKSVSTIILSTRPERCSSQEPCCFCLLLALKPNPLVPRCIMEQIKVSISPHVISVENTFQHLHIYCITTFVWISQREHIP